MQTFREVIGLWPTAVALAEDLGEKDVTVRAWGARNSIPAARWSDVVASAEKRQIEGVSLELLATIAASRRAPGEAA